MIGDAIARRMMTIIVQRAGETAISALIALLDELDGSHDDRGLEAAVEREQKTHLWRFTRP